MLATTSVLLVPVLAVSGASAGTLDQFCGGIESTGGGGSDELGTNAPNGTSGCGTSTSQTQDNSAISNVLLAVVNILSVIIGIVAVIMILVGGFRFITSGGESSKVAGAKNAIIYAVIGIVIVALAQIIVRFVINRSLGATSSATPKPKASVMLQLAPLEQSVLYK